MAAAGPSPGRTISREHTAHPGYIARPQENRYVLAVSILARDRNGPAIARQILIMPMHDDRTVTPDPQLAPFAGWTRDDNAPAGRP